MEETKIKINGKEYTIEEARKIKDDLDLIFSPNIVPFNPYPVNIPWQRPVEPFWEYLPYTVTYSDHSGVQWADMTDHKSMGIF